MMGFREQGWNKFMMMMRFRKQGWNKFMMMVRLRKQRWNMFIMVKMIWWSIVILYRRVMLHRNSKMFLTDMLNIYLALFPVYLILHYLVLSFTPASRLTS